MRKSIRCAAAFFLALVMTLSSTSCSSKIPLDMVFPGSLEDSNESVELLSISVSPKKDSFTAKDGTVLMETSFDVISVSGSNEKAAAKIEKFCADELAFRNREFADEMKYYIEEYEESSDDELFGPTGYYNLTASVIRSDENLFTLLYCEDSYYMGAVHPTHYIYTYSFDAQTGEQVRMENLGLNGRDPVEDVSYLLAKRFLASPYCDMDVYSLEDAYYDFFYELVGGECEPALLYDAWYISGDELVFICNEYFYASYSEGAFVITFTEKELEGIIDSKWFSDGKTYLPDHISGNAVIDENSISADDDELEEDDSHMDSYYEGYGEGYDEGYTDGYETAYNDIWSQINRPIPLSALYDEDDDRFDYIYTVDIPSDYMEENLIWWGCDVYDIEIYELEWDENFDSAVGGNIVCSLDECLRGEAVLLQAYIPETIPSHGMSAVIDGERYDWALCYNGRDGGLSFVEIDPQAA